MKKKLFLIIAIILIAAAAVFLVVSRRAASGNRPFSSGMSTPMVDAVNPTYGAISNETALIGTIQPNDSVTVYAKAGGDVTEVNVKAGDYVNAGDPICTIDTRQVAQAKANYDNAQLQLKNAREELSRQQLLYNIGELSDQAYSNYQNAVEQAQISLSSAKTSYETQLEYSSVKAAISGKVEQCSIEVHDSLNAGTLICVISGEGMKNVNFSVTERIRDGIAVGDKMRLLRNDNEYTATITEVSTMADQTTGLYDVKAAIDETSGDVAVLSTGSKAKIYVVSSHTDHTLTLPKNCIYSESAGDFVYTITDHVLAKVPVTTGMEDKENIEILEGLTEKDLVVASWSAELDEGKTVRIKGEADSEAGGAGENGAGGGMPEGAGFPGGGQEGGGMPQGAPAGAQ